VLARKVGADGHLVWNDVREQQIQPFHQQKVQALGAEGYLHRDKFEH
jgi:hypothetical protein